MEQPNFTKGSLVISTTGVNVRIQPASTVAFTAPPNTPATVLDGSVMVDDLPWYQIRGGWVARHNHVNTLWEPLVERVQNMYADKAFVECVQVVLGIEGGLMTEEQARLDKFGGMTNYGISQRAHPHVDITGLTRRDAMRIYYACYWLASGADKLLDPALQRLHFDAAVNHGVPSAANWLAKSEENFTNYLAMRLRAYANSATVAVHGAGWLNRLATIIETEES